MKNKNKKDKVSDMEKIKQLAEIDVNEAWNMRHGYDVESVKEFSDELRGLCAKHDLIRIARDRHAGEKFDPEIHDNSDTYVDRFIELIVHELIQVKKEEWSKMLEKYEGKQ